MHQRHDKGADPGSIPGTGENFSVEIFSMVKVIQEGQWFKSSHAGLGCHAVNSSTLSPIDSVRPHNCEKYISEELRKRRRWKAKSKKKRRWTARLNLTHQLRSGAR